MSEFRFESAGVLGTGLMGALFLTTRFQVVGAEAHKNIRDSGQPVMFACWHGLLLPLVHIHRHEGIVVLVSEHEDGEYIARVLHRHGFGTARGSSTRGGTRGLRGLVRAARAGKDLAVTPDGPTGPHRVFKPGIVVAAQVAQVPIVPIAVRADVGWRFKSWDGFMVPRPLSSLTVEYLEPVYVPRDTTRAGAEEIADRIGARLNEACDP